MHQTPPPHPHPLPLPYKKKKKKKVELCLWALVLHHFGKWNKTTRLTKKKKKTQNQRKIHEYSITAAFTHHAVTPNIFKTLLSRGRRNGLRSHETKLPVWASGLIYTSVSTRGSASVRPHVNKTRIYRNGNEEKSKNKRFPCAVGITPQYCVDENKRCVIAEEPLIFSPFPKRVYSAGSNASR